jgi:acyl-CoA synthetase (AMP-forming)/AMP-acid ligase II
MRIVDALDHHRRETPEREAVVCGSVRLSYAQLTERVHRLAQAFFDLGLANGARLAVLGTNCHRYLECYLAASASGTVLVPLNHRLAPRELAEILTDSEASVLVIDPRFLTTLEAIRSDLPLLQRIVVLADSAPDGAIAYEKLLESAPTSPPRATPRDPEDVLYLFYTSGTTGRPKGVMLSERSITFAVETCLNSVRFTAADRYLHSVSLGHRAAIGFLLGTLIGGGCVCLTDFEPDRCLSQLEHERITVTALVPTMINLVLNATDPRAYDLSTWRLLIYGASPMPEQLMRQAMRTLGVGLLQSYGMTELTTATMLMPDDHVLEAPTELVRRLKSAGRPVAGVDVRVVDEHDDDVACGEVGEIIVRGPCMMTGYWKQPEASAEALRDGWMHTGDMGMLDSDGYLYLVDRKKDMIISGGENVYSTEVESVLYQHPAVLEAAVIGVPDPMWVEGVKAIVALKHGQHVSADDLRSFCRERIAGYKVPRTVDFMESLPKTATGKISKKDLRTPYWAAEPGQTARMDLLVESSGRVGA